MWRFPRRRVIFCVVIQTASLPSSPSTRPARDLDPDGVLVEAWVNRADEAAFARLVERHQGYVFRLALSVLGPGFEGDAEDVTQEVFIRVAERLHEFRGESTFRTWLWRLAFNMAMDRRRRPRWRKPHVDPTLLEARAATGETDDPFVSAVAAERRRALRSCLETLPDGLRSVIRLRYWMDLQIEDIAGMLQIPCGTVKRHLYRGRELLLRAMRARDDDGPRLARGGRASPVNRDRLPRAGRAVVVRERTEPSVGRMEAW